MAVIYPHGPVEDDDPLREEVQEGGKGTTVFIVKINLQRNEEALLRSEGGEFLGSPRPGRFTVQFSRVWPKVPSPWGGPQPSARAIALPWPYPARAYGGPGDAGGGLP